MNKYEGCAGCKHQYEANTDYCDTCQPPNQVNSNVCVCIFSDEDDRKFLEGQKCVYCLKTITAQR